MLRLGNDCLIENHITAVNRTASTAVSGTGKARGRYRGALFIVSTGTLGAATTLDFKAEQSDDNSNWSDITGGAITQLVAADDDKAAIVDVRPTKKYVRGTMTPGGTVANGVLSGVTLVLYDPESLPVTNTPAGVVV